MKIKLMNQIDTIKPDGTGVEMTELKHENITIDKKIKNILIDTAKNSRLETVFILFGHDKITHILQLENDSSNRIQLCDKKTWY